MTCFLERENYYYLIECPERHNPLKLSKPKLEQHPHWTEPGGRRPGPSGRTCVSSVKPTDPREVTEVTGMLTHVGVTVVYDER